MKNNKIFLSIDMDYWNDWSEDICYETLWNILNKTKYLPRDRKTAVMNHQQMLRFVDKSLARHFVNVDYHSDLAATGCDVFECGTWISYIKWRKENNAKYTWIRPVRNVYAGDCSNFEIFENINKNYLQPIIKPTNTDWNEIKFKCISPKRLLKDNIFNNVSNVSLCLSPTYIKSNILEDIFREMVDRFNLRYYKGVRDEQNSPRASRALIAV